MPARWWPRPTATRARSRPSPATSRADGSPDTPAATSTPCSAIGCGRWASTCASSPARGSSSTSTPTGTSTARPPSGRASPFPGRTRWRSPAATAPGSCSACWSPTPSSAATRADARDRRLGRLRRVPGLHRRLPDRRDPRGGSPRRAALPLLPLAVAAGGAAIRRGVRGPGLRLRHLPGRLPVEPRRRAPGRRARAGRRRRRLPAAGRLAGVVCRIELAERYRRLYVPDLDGRHLQRNARVALANVSRERARARPS